MTEKRNSADETKNEGTKKRISVSCVFHPFKYTNKLSHLFIIPAPPFPTAFSSSNPPPLTINRDPFDSF